MLCFPLWGILAHWYNAFIDYSVLQKGKCSNDNKKMLNLHCFIVTADDKHFFSECLVSFAEKLGSLDERNLLNWWKHEWKKSRVL